MCASKTWLERRTGRVSARLQLWQNITNRRGFALLLDNGYEVWCDMARRNEEGTSDIKPKFTGGRAAGGCGKYGGQMMVLLGSMNSLLW
jgi:hypothetical protein